MTAPDPQQPADVAQEPPRLDGGPFVPPAPLLPGERAEDPSPDPATAAS